MQITWQILKLLLEGIFSEEAVDAWWQEQRRSGEEGQIRWSWKHMQRGLTRSQKLLSSPIDFFSKTWKICEYDVYKKEAKWIRECFERHWNDDESVIELLVVRTNQDIHLFFRHHRPKSYAWLVSFNSCVSWSTSINFLLVVNVTLQPPYSKSIFVQTIQWLLVSDLAILITPYLSSICTCKHIMYSLPILKFILLTLHLHANKWFMVTSSSHDCTIAQ